jgi:prefoldin subunit 5
MPAGMPAPVMPAMPVQQEISILESQAAMLEQQLEQIKKRINELKR